MTCRCEAIAAWCAANCRTGTLGAKSDPAAHCNNDSLVHACLHIETCCKPGLTACEMVWLLT